MLNSSHNKTDTFQAKRSFLQSSFINQGHTLVFTAIHITQQAPRRNHLHFPNISAWSKRDGCERGEAFHARHRVPWMAIYGARICLANARVTRGRNNALLYITYMRSALMHTKSVVRACERCISNLWIRLFFSMQNSFAPQAVCFQSILSSLFWFNDVVFVGTHS